MSMFRTALALAHLNRVRPAATVLGNRRGSVVVEFALVMPIMVTTLLGVVDAARAVIAWQRVTSTAQAVAEIATEEASQPNAVGVYQLTDAQVQAATTAIYAFMPAVKGGTDKSIFAVTLTAVAYTANPGCTNPNNCTYTANVAWSVVGSYDPALVVPPLTIAQSIADLARPCGVQTQVAASLLLPPSLTTLPTQGVPGMTSLIVADVLYVFQPLFFYFITGPINMHRAAYLPPRTGGSAAYIQYVVASETGTDYADVCTGYQ